LAITVKKTKIDDQKTKVNEPRSNNNENYFCAYCQEKHDAN
jgi:hypothetical protein